MLDFSLYQSGTVSVGIIDDFKSWIGSKLQTVINFFRDILFDVFKSITDFLKAFLLTIFDALKDVFFFAFDALVGFMVSLMSGLGSLFSALDFTNVFSSMPTEVLNIMGLVGLGHCMGLIVTSLIIRMSLQLVPFTRLGS